MPRNGTKNLIPTNKRSKEEAKILGKKGGIASGKARREKKTLRECLDLLLEKQIKDKKGEEVSGAEAISIELFKQALKGNIRAFETIRDTAGQKPVEKIMVSEINQETIDEVERMVNSVK